VGSQVAPMKGFPQLELGNVPPWTVALLAASTCAALTTAMALGFGSPDLLALLAMTVVLTAILARQVTIPRQIACSVLMGVTSVALSWPFGLFSSSMAVCAVLLAPITWTAMFWGKSYDDVVLFLPRLRVSAGRASTWTLLSIVGRTTLEKITAERAGTARISATSISTPSVVNRTRLTVRRSAEGRWLVQAPEQHRS
jgi:hypothetical protein